MRRWRVPAAGALAALLLVGIYLVGFHQPRSDKIAALHAEADQLRAQQAPLRQSIQALEKVAAREPELSAALRLLERLIPSGLAQPELLAHVQDAAKGAGVELVSVTFGDANAPKDAPRSSVPGTVLVTMPVTVVVNGTFAGITDMLRRVEVEKDRAVLVGAVSVTEADSGFPQLTGTWTGQAYALLGADDPLLVDPNAPPAPPDSTTTPPGDAP